MSLHSRTLFEMLSCEQVPPSHSPTGGAMRIDLSNACKSGQRIIDNVISLLPNLALAIVIFLLFLVVACAAKLLARRQRGQTLALLLGQLAHTFMVIL